MSGQVKSNEDETATAETIVRCFDVFQPKYFQVGCPLQFKQIIVIFLVFCVAVIYPYLYISVIQPSYYEATIFHYLYLQWTKKTHCTIMCHVMGNGYKYKIKDSVGSDMQCAFYVLASK